MRKGDSMTMALYMANQIEKGNVSYKAIFSKKMWKPYQDDVDAILTADGKQDLIESIE